MLTWKSVTDKNQTLFQARAEGKADIVANALVDMWRKVLDELDSSSEAYTWDYLICQLITQCGVAMIFPAGRDKGELFDAKFVVELTVDTWSEIYEALPDPENETRFQEAYENLHIHQLTTLKDAINDKRLKSRFAALKRRNSFAVFCVDEGETPIYDRMEFLWGNRPAKREFLTAKELFEHIFHKAELTPQYSMRLSGKNVIAVNWFGHEFTDRFVELLEGVSNLASLCNDLTDFMLTATRVTDTGQERLKNLLPHTRLTVVSDQEFKSGVDPWYEKFVDP